MCVCKRESECETQLLRMSRTGTDEHLIREPLGTSWLKDGADVAVPRRSPSREVHENQEDPTEGRGTVRLFGTNNPKKEAV
jgi:hypothetical protein